MDVIRAGGVASVIVRGITYIAYLLYPAWLRALAIEAAWSINLLIFLRYQFVRDSYVSRDWIPNRITDGIRPVPLNIG